MRGALADLGFPPGKRMVLSKNSRCINAEKRQASKPACAARWVDNHVHSTSLPVTMPACSKLLTGVIQRRDGLPLARFNCGSRYLRQAAGQ